ncbi:hypothetical protein BvCmsJ76A_04922 [Escherichia coli]|nr:hypothetical protein BvCmsJ76A_04922 [Escherichia coli]GDK35515.1 hypothetical protein BvCmsKSP054_05268 [Escherichia coli]GDM60336.1 hypothetical protein BvCmsKSP061_05193 [Escherichia coli]
MTADIIRHTFHITFTGKNVRVVVLNERHPHAARLRPFRAAPCPRHPRHFTRPAFKIVLCTAGRRILHPENQTGKQLRHRFHIRTTGDPCSGHRGRLVDPRLRSDKRQFRPCRGISRTTGTFGLHTDIQRTGFTGQ